MLAAGGKLWENAGKRRVYFNNTESLFGMNCTQFGTGNIKSARMDGVEISNSLARKIYADLDDIKLWVDLADNSIQAHKANARTNADYNYCDFLPEALHDLLDA